MRFVVFMLGRLPCILAPNSVWMWIFFFFVQFIIVNSHLTAKECEVKLLHPVVVVLVVLVVVLDLVRAASPSDFVVLLLFCCPPPPPP